MFFSSNPSQEIFGWTFLQHFFCCYRTFSLHLAIFSLLLSIGPTEHPENCRRTYGRKWREKVENQFSPYRLRALRPLSVSPPCTEEIRRLGSGVTPGLFFEDPEMFEHVQTSPGTFCPPASSSRRNSKKLNRSISVSSPAFLRPVLRLLRPFSGFSALPPACLRAVRISSVSPPAFSDHGGEDTEKTRRWPETGRRSRRTGRRKAGEDTETNILESRRVFSHEIAGGDPEEIRRK